MNTDDTTCPACGGTIRVGQAVIVVQGTALCSDRCAWSYFPVKDTAPPPPGTLADQLAELRTAWLDLLETIATEAIRTARGIARAIRHGNRP